MSLWILVPAIVGGIVLGVFATFMYIAYKMRDFMG